MQVNAQLFCFLQDAHNKIPLQSYFSGTRGNKRNKCVMSYVYYGETWALVSHKFQVSGSGAKNMYDKSCWQSFRKITKETNCLNSVVCRSVMLPQRPRSFIISIVSIIHHPDFESRWCLCSRAAAWIHFRESGSIPELQEIIFTLSTPHRSFFLVTGKIIQPDVTLSTSVVAFVVIVDKDFKPLRLMWGHSGSDRL